MSEPTITTPAVILSIAVNPFQNGTRTIVISGAPAGEMPVVRSGKFSEMHPLLDEVWLELNKRKPKVVIKPKVSADAKVAVDDSAEEASADADQLKAEADFAETKVFDLSEPPPDQLVRSETAVADAPDEPDAEPLPVIAGDTA